MYLDPLTPQSAEFERRTALKAAAWGGAAVVFSIAAPAASASPSDASNWGISLSVTTGAYPTSGTRATRYQWVGTSNDYQPKVTWLDGGSNTWSTGTMTVTYLFAKNTSSRLTSWYSTTPYKLASATQYNAANETTNSTLLAQNDIVQAYDGRSWTCVSILNSGSGVSRTTTVTFTSNTPYTSQPNQQNTLYLPRLGVKLDFALTYPGSSVGTPFGATVSWQPDQSIDSLYGLYFAQLQSF